MDKNQKKNPENRNANSEKDRDRPRKQGHESQNQEERLLKEDLPDSTNESRGTTGSG